MEWGWIEFCARIREIQISTNLAHDEAIRKNLIMDEVDWYGDVLDVSGHSLGLKDVNARLAIFVDWRGT